MKRLFLLNALVILMLNAYMQTPADLQEQFIKNGEIYFCIDIGATREIPDLKNVISIDHVTENKVFAYANAYEFDAFRQHGIDFQLLPHPNENFNPLTLDIVQIKNTDTWDFYPTYEAYVAMMHQFETDYPSLCDIDTIGQSVNGRLLLAARISDNVGVDEAEPEFLYTSSMHGDELTGYVLMLRLIDSLLTAYGTDARITNLVDNLDIFINPLANPDGAYNAGNHTVSGAIRYNANGYDLNRNFPDVITGLHPNTQPETYHFMDFAESRHFVMAANFHGGFEVFNYPWDHKYALTADDSWWQLVGHEYADTAQTYSPSGYMTAYDDGIVNGATWYVIDGGRQDYMNYYHQCREVTLEISDTKLIPAGQLPAHWEYNRRSLLNYMEQCLYGVHGIVTDPSTAQPIEAKVYVKDYEIDGDSSWVYTGLPFGNYYRLLYEGTYDISFSAPCYKTKTYVYQDVMNYQSTELNIELEPTIAGFYTPTPIIKTGESLDFFNPCTGPLSWNWSFEGGTPGQSTTNNPSGILYSTAGRYDVKLQVTDGVKEDSVYKKGYVIVADEILMNNGNVNVDYGLFYDSGGENNNYSNYEDYILTIYPELPNSSVKVEFFEFELQSGYNCNSDRLEIYDGCDLVSPLVSQHCDTDKPETLVSTHSSGALTFYFHSNFFSTYPGWKALITNEVKTSELDLTLFLEGPFAQGEMSTAMNSQDILPLQQPYGQSPTTYFGSENVTAIPNPDVVDWILIEVRDAPDATSADASTTFEKLPAFILKDGSVTALDGSSLPKFRNSVVNQLFVAVHHRNHLSMMSAVPLTENAGVYTYDFTDSLSKAYQDGQVEVSPGIFGMAGGDSNSDGKVDEFDKDLNWSVDAGLSGYRGTDLNMDGEINNPDKAEIWNNNTGLESQVPE